MPPARSEGAAGRPWEMSAFIAFPVHIDPQQQTFQMAIKLFPPFSGSWTQ